VKAYQSSAKYQLVRVGDEDLEIGGCMYVLTPDRPQARGTHAMSPNSTLVQIERFDDVDALNRARAA
ncbi:MAG: hypothetical protein MI723_08130, partial [Caulobacterales bacterium]|nr:hypothetical protein [Caulobacterales bacterium]